MVFQPLACGIDQHGGHVLRGRNRRERIQADFFQGIEAGGSAGRIGRIERIETQGFLPNGLTQGRGAWPAEDSVIWKLDLQPKSSTMPL
jgi:hypothetical protein